MTNSVFWDGWILVLTLACIGLVTWVLFSTRKTQRKGLTDETTGHSYDGIEELDNPLPQWWFWMFIATLVFGAVYLVIYPGVWKGAIGWTQVGQLESEEAKYREKYAPIFDKYAAMPIEEVIKEPQALKMGQRIFSNNCAICHGSDARGAFGFPNLADNDWLYGGTPSDITTTLLNGRHGQMPAWSAMIGEKGVREVAAYVRTLSQLPVTLSDKELASGKKIFETTCAACHGVDGAGNQQLGAPNLTNNIWLYGSSQAQLEYTIRNGRNGVMPAWKHVLGEQKVHLVAAYVYSLTHKESK